MLKKKKKKRNQQSPKRKKKEHAHKMALPNRYSAMPGNVFSVTLVKPVWSPALMTNVVKCMTHLIVSVLGPGRRMSP